MPELQKKEEDAVFIEDNPQNILQKLLNLSTAIFKERLAYTKHLADLLILLKDEGA